MIFGKPQSRLTSIVAVFLCGVLSGLSLNAAAAEPDWSLDQLMQQLASTEASSIAYREEKRIQYLTEPLFSEGRLSFRPPDTLERLVTRPKREKITANGNILAIESNAKDPPVKVLLSDYPLLAATLTAMRAMLSADQAALEAVFVARLSGTETDWLLQLVPRSEALSALLQEIQVRGGDGGIESIDVLETAGDRTSLFFVTEP